MVKFKCKLCGYEWESRLDVPKTCPRCKRYDYYSTEDELELIEVTA